MQKELVRPDPKKLIFSTIHGSRLYGLHHENSDEDRFEVYATKDKILQGFEEGDDWVSVGLDHFLKVAREGSHQSLEALYSPFKVWAMPEYYAMIEGFRVPPAAGVREAYERTIERFCSGDFKRRRHALRLALNLRDLQRYARFNPRLDAKQIEHISLMAEFYVGAELYGYAVHLMEDI